MTRILIIEDEFFAALEMETMLRAIGCQVVATVPDFGGALQAANSNDFDVAVLDINLSGTHSYPVAELLIEREVPVIFSTGYSMNRLPERFRRVPCVQKPVDPLELENLLLQVLGDAS